MSIISNTAPYTPPANLNADALTVTKYQPASLFNSSQAFTLDGISSIFSANQSLALAPSKVNVAPVVETVKVGSVYTSTAPTTLTTGQSTGQPSSFLTGLGNVATGILNLGANVLLAKYASNDQPATVASAGNSVPSDKTAPAEKVFENGQPITTGFNSLLESLGNAFVSRQQYQTSGGVQVSSSPMLSYVLIGAVVLVIILMARK